MRALKLLAGLTSLWGLTACHATLQPPAGHERVDLLIQPTLMNAPALQAAIKPWTKHDIAKLDVLPYVRTPDGSFKPISGMTGLPVEPGDPTRIRLSMASPSIDFDRPIRLSNMRVQQHYRIYAQAYAQDDAGNETLISTDDAGSYAEISVGNSDQPQLSAARLPVTLQDKRFTATAEVTLGVQGATNRVETLAAGVYRLDGSTFVELRTPQSLQKAALPGKLTLTHLRSGTTYRVLATAKDASAGTLATGSVDVPVGIDTDAGARQLMLPIPEYPLSARVGP